MKRRCIPLAVLFTLHSSVCASADEQPNPFALDVSLQRQHQSFDDSSADIDTVSLQPHYFAGNWNFSLLLPWQHVDGEYFVNGFQPQATYLCQRYGKLTDAQIRFLQRRTDIDTQSIEDFCSSEEIGATTVDEENSGLSDIMLSAHYGVAIGDAGTWIVSTGAAYKWDNGDADTGIGSGTRETSVDVSLNGEADHWRVSALVGYAFVSPSDADIELDDYAFASIDGAWKFAQVFALGIAGDYEQSYVPELDDIISATLYLEWSPLQWVRLTVASRDYLDTEGFPEREYTASTTFLF